MVFVSYDKLVMIDIYAWGHCAQTYNNDTTKFNNTSHFSFITLVFVLYVFGKRARHAVLELSSSSTIIINTRK